LISKKKTYFRYVQFRRPRPFSTSEENDKHVPDTNEDEERGGQGQGLQDGGRKLANIAHEPAEWRRALDWKATRNNLS
jgi:hypothetical protein